MNIEREYQRWMMEHFPTILEKWEKHKKEFLREHYQEKFESINRWLISAKEVPEDIRKGVKMILKMQDKNPENGNAHVRLITQLCRKLEGWPYFR